MIRRMLAATAVAALVPAGLVAATQTASAQCKGGCDDGTITVSVSDTTPASGEQFVARGKLIIGGKPAAAHNVKVQTLRSGDWQPIVGATVVTDSDGKYRVRLILQTTGQRQLRVVGVGQGAGEPNERQRFSVTVH